MLCHYFLKAKLSTGNVSIIKQIFEHLILPLLIVVAISFLLLISFNVLSAQENTTISTSDIYSKYDDDNKYLGEYQTTITKTDIERPNYLKEIKSLRTPSSYTTYKNNKYTTIIYSGNNYIADHDKWYLIDYEEKLVQKKISFKWFNTANAQSTFYTTYDGSLRTDANASWDFVHDQASANYEYGASANYYSANSASNGSSNYIIARGYFIFNTYSVFSAYENVKIGTSSLFLYVTNKYNQDADGYDYVTCTEFFPADPTSVVVADYNDYSDSSACANLDLDDINLSAYNEWPLNSIGTSTIATSSGYTSLGLREGHDIADHPILSTDKTNRIYTDFVEQTGTNQDPYLVINWATSTAEEEEKENATSTLVTGSLPLYNDIAVISGYIEHYTDSTSTPSEIEYITYHIPFFVWLFFWLVLSFFFGRILIEILIILRK